MTPSIIVYGKPGCAVCEAAKGKLKKMGLAFTEHNAEDYKEYRDDWRDGAYIVRAAMAENDERLPVIRIGDDFHSYPAAMRILKARGGAHASG